MQTRNTVQRNAVLRTVQEMKNHPTAEEIYLEINRIYPNISRGTVYRNLNFLAEQGVILKVLIPDAADRFDFNISEHYHFKCSGCGKVFDADIPYQRNINEKVADKHGFTVTGHTIVFSGKCADCK